MNLIIKKSEIPKSLNSALLCICISVAIIIPNDFYNIKKISLFLLLIINSVMLITEIKKYKMILLFGVLFPIITTLFSIILSNATLFEIISKAYTPLYMLMVVIIRYYKIDYKRIILFSLKLIALIVVISTALDWFGYLSIYDNPILTFLRENNSAKVGKADAYIALGYMIFIQSSPLLLFLLGISIKTKSVFWIIITLVAIFFSGARALWIISVIEMFLILQTDKKNISKKYRFIFAITLIIILLIALPNIVDVLQNSFKLKESGDAVRDGHLISVKNEILESFGTLFFGHGFADYFFSIGNHEIVNVVELSYWDLLRQLGLIGFIPFMCFILYPIKRLYKCDVALCVVYIGYLFVAYYNPLLYTSTAFVMYVLAYDECYIFKKIMNNKRGRYNDESHYPRRRRRHSTLPINNGNQQTAVTRI